MARGSCYCPLGRSDCIGFLPVHFSTLPSPFKALSEVKPYKSTWRVQVKILHTWKQYTAQSGETFEMVLSDQTVMIYRIGKMWSGSDIDALDDHEDSDPVTNPSQIISSDEDLAVTEVVTPSSTPSSKRGPDAANVERSSTTKKICLKTVKMEKEVEKKPNDFEANDKGKSIGGDAKD